MSDLSKIVSKYIQYVAAPGTIAPDIIHEFVDYKKGKYNQRLYDAIDPTSSYADAPKHLFNFIAGNKVNKSNNPVADAAWRKRLGFSYDKTLLIDNPDGSVHLPKQIEKEILTDKNFLKKRIKLNEEKDSYDSKILQLIHEDKKYLKQLEDIDEGDTERVSEFSAWKNRKMNDKNITPLNVMGHFKLSKKDGEITYQDTYDFNIFEPFVPGKSFKIKGKIK